jgi:hypothetical protein
MEIIVHNYIRYDKSNGKLFWIKDNKEIGYLDRGYRYFGFNYKKYQYHSLIWWFEKGNWPKLIDHIDGNPLNNHISNLRESTYRENSQNRKTHREGRLYGCFYQKLSNKWIAQIRLNGKQCHIGSFKTELEAHNAYKKKLEDLCLR